MRYFITDYKNQDTKNDLHSLGLYCYSLRSSDDNWGEIATIENHVLINRYGSIITDEEIILGDKYPDDFIDFEDFALKNKKVNSISDLKDGLEDYGIIDLSDDKNINDEFASLFEVCENFQELDKMTLKQKYNYFIEHYNSVNDYKLIHNGGHIYQLFHINKEIKKDKELDNA